MDPSFCSLLSFLSVLANKDIFLASVALGLDIGSGLFLLTFSATCRAARAEFPVEKLVTALTTGFWDPAAPPAARWLRCVHALTGLGLLPQLSPARDELSCVVELCQCCSAGPTQLVVWAGLPEYVGGRRAGVIAILVARPPAHGWFIASPL
jgi:hypothetical protein